MQSTKKGILYAILTMWLFASMDAGSKYLTLHYSVVQIVWVRYLFFVVFAILVIGPSQLASTLRTQRLGLQVVRSLVLVGEVTTFVIAFRYLPLADVHGVAAVTPLLTVALAAIFLREKVASHRWVAVAVGFVGVLIIVRPGSGVMDRTALFPLLAALFWGVYQILVRLASRFDSAKTTWLYTGLVGAAVVTLVAPFQWRTPDRQGWLLLLLVGLLGTCAHFCLIKALEAARASTLQPFNYTLTVWAAVMGFVVFGDLPDIWTVAGTGIVVSGGIYSLRGEGRIAGQEDSASAP